MITPAISVLSAVEGLKVVAAVARDDLVVPITAAIIVLLFASQRLRDGGGRPPLRPGDGRLVPRHRRLRDLGHRRRTRRSSRRSRPTYAVEFLVGHFGDRVLRARRGRAGDHRRRGALRRHGPLRPARRSPRAWLLLVFPALILNYMGQGALLLDHPGGGTGTRSSCWSRTGGGCRWSSSRPSPTVIASQAVITGAFSVAHQAVQLGYLPRLRIVHTSAKSIGQIYVPWINWLLMAAVLTLVFAFQHLGRARLRLRHGGDRDDHDHDPAVLLRRPPPVEKAALAGDRGCGRLPDRRPALPGREPDQAPPRRLAAAPRRPRGLHRADHLAAGPAAGDRAARARRKARLRTSSTSCTAAGSRCGASPGTAVFLNRSKATTPLAMRANVEHNQILHEHVVILSIETLPMPQRRRRRAPRGRRPRLRRRRHQPSSPPASATWSSPTSRRRCARPRAPG